jgi:capsular polysaccharide biosynthesis protein
MILSLVLAIMLGGILGIGFGLFAELLDRRVRSRDDIANILGVPVFAIIDNKPKKSSRMNLFPRNNPGLLTA